MYSSQRALTGAGEDDLQIRCGLRASVYRSLMFKDNNMARPL